MADKKPTLTEQLGGLAAIVSLLDLRLRKAEARLSALEEYEAPKSPSGPTVNTIPRSSRFRKS